MPHPHGKTLQEHVEALAAAPLPEHEKPTLAQLAAEVAAQRAMLLELARMIASQDIPSRSRGLSWSGDPQPGDVA